MLAKIKNDLIDFSKPLDISIPMRGDDANVNAWYVDPPKIEPHVEGDFVGKVSEGASINFNNIQFNPHAHGTHTECVGHITKEFHSVNQNLKKFFFKAEVITIAPEKYQDDFVISRKQLQYAIGNKKREAIVIRTLPNTRDKKSRQYSHTNPPYLLEEAALYLVRKGIKHLLIDQPSVDKEKDGGALLAHNAFWNTQGTLRKQATITEFIYVANRIKDGAYYLNLQVAPFDNDASPSRPVLYKIERLMRATLKLEELMMFVWGVYLFSLLPFQWWWFLVLILLPDVGMIGYIFGDKTGALLYNLFHHKGVAIAIYLLGVYLANDLVLLTGIILFTHSAMDRIFGYGLKYDKGFKFTHLGELGNNS